MKIALLFFTFVIFLVLLAFGFRIFLLVLQSKYDGKHRFTLAVYATNSEKERVINIISAAPETRTLSVLRVTGNNLTDAFPIQRYLAIPIDATLVLSEQKKYPKDYDGLLESLLFSYKTVKTDLTLIDVLRFYIFAKSLSRQVITFKELAVEEYNTVASQAAIDTIVSQLFFDPSFTSEKVSIQVVNGSEVQGLGNRLGRLITNMGGNVIMVTSANQVYPRSEILATNTDSYSVAKLAKTLGLTVREVKKDGISDIIIHMGKDNQRSVRF